MKVYCFPPSVKTLLQYKKNVQNAEFPERFITGVWGNGRSSCYNKSWGSWKQKYVSQDVRDGKKNNKGWLILHIQRLFCGEEECEMLEHVAGRRLSQKDVAEDAITAGTMVRV